MAKKPGKRGPIQVALDKALIEALVKAVSRGVPPRAAALTLGINSPTYVKWINKGRAEMEHMAEHGTFSGGSDTEEWLSYELTMRMQSAAAKAFEVYQKKIHAAAKKNWRAALALMDRFYDATVGEDSPRSKAATITVKPTKPGEDAPTVQVHLYIPDNGRGPCQTPST